MPRGQRATSEEPKAGPPASFEDLYAALEDRARRLEQGNLPLDQALKLCEEGSAIAAQLREIIAGAELRVTELRRRFDLDPDFAEEPAVYDDGFDPEDEL